MELEYLDDSVQIDDLDVPKSVILNAITKHDEMYKVKMDAERIILYYKQANSWIVGLIGYRQERISVSRSMKAIMRRFDDVDQVYDIFKKISLKVIKILMDIVNSPNNPWENVIILHKAELLEIVNRRLISSADLLESCNELQQSVLNVFNPIIDIFHEFSNLTDVETFESFLVKSKIFIDKEKKNLNACDIRRKRGILLSNKCAIFYHRYRHLHGKREKYNKEANLFKNDIKDWKMKAYSGEAENDAWTTSSTETS